MPLTAGPAFTSVYSVRCSADSLRMPAAATWASSMGRPAADMLAAKSIITARHSTTRTGRRAPNRRVFPPAIQNPNSQIKNASSFHRQRPQRKPRRGAGNLVRRAHVAELVHLVAGQVFQVVELADVHPLLDDQVFVHGDERVGAFGSRGL